MEDLTKSLDNIADILKGSSPGWITLFTAFVPILLTLITIILSFRMDKQNRALQKLIHNRDVLNQSRQDILSIYNAFSEALVSLQMIGTVESVFSNEQNTYLWNQEINNRKSDLINACNKAKLMFNDNQLTNHLMESIKVYNEICTCVSRYIYNNTHAQVLQNARSAVASQFGTVAYDPTELSKNTAAREQLIKLCENENTREISAKIQVFSEMLNEKQFDAQFKKYIEIQEIDKKA